MNSLIQIENTTEREIIGQVEDIVYNANSQIENKDQQIRNLNSLATELEKHNIWKVIKPAGTKGGCVGYIAKELGYTPAEMASILHNSEWSHEKGNIIGYFSEEQGITIRNHVGIHKNGKITSKMNCYGAIIEHKKNFCSPKFGNKVAYLNISPKK